MGKKQNVGSWVLCLEYNYQYEKHKYQNPDYDGGAWGEKNAPISMEERMKSL